MGIIFRTGHVMESSIAFSIVSCISGYAFLLNLDEINLNYLHKEKLENAPNIQLVNFDTLLLNLYELLQV